MERINGYLDLDDYFMEIEDQHPENMNYLYDSGLVMDAGIDNQYWIIVEGKRYYFKETSNGYQEMIAEEVAKFLGLETAEYDLAFFNGLKGVISRDFKKEGAQYIGGDDLLKEYFKKNPETVIEMGLQNDWILNFKQPYYSEMNNLEIIWQALESRYKDNPKADIEKLMKQVIDLYIFSILIGHGDRISVNWQIEEGDEIKLGPIFDNADAFIENPEVNMSTNFNDNLLTPSESIKEFLKISDSSYRAIFKNKFEALTEENFWLLIEKVEKKIGTLISSSIKDYIFKNFRENREAIAKVLKEFDKSL